MRAPSLFLVFLLGCADPAPPAADLVLREVSVLDVEAGEWTADRSIYVADGRIVAVLDAGSTVPAEAVVVDGGGGYVIPGLWDAHVHSVSNRAWHFPLMLAHGVTAVRNMHTTEVDAFASIDRVRQDIREGVVPPLRFIANGPIVDGEAGAWPGSVVITDPARASTVVDSLAEGGADFIKIYDNVSVPVFTALLEAATARGIPVDGHAPMAVPMKAAAEAGMRTVEHLSGMVQGCSREAGAVAEAFADFVNGPELPFPSGDSLYLSLIRRLSDTEDPVLCAELVESYAAMGTASTPTLVNGVSMGDPGAILDDEPGVALLPAPVKEQWAMMAGPGPGEMLSSIMAPVAAKAPQQVRTLHEAGVPILAGTDTGNPFIVPGASLHRELRLLAAAGLSPAEAIRAATRTPAEVFGLADSLGLVTAGFVADLVLLEDDPLVDLEATRHISAVVLRGRLYDREALDALVPGTPGNPPGPTVGAIERLAPEFDALVPADARLEVLAEGHGWTEGPVWVDELGGLLYSDIPANSIFLYRDGVGSEPWLAPSEGDPSGSGASNGLILDTQGRLVLAQHGDRRLARLDAGWEAPGATAPEARFTTLARGVEGGRFNSPNDLVQGPRGDIYFTDPPYGLAGGDDDPAKELDSNGVYRLTPDGEVHVVDATLARPNGIALSPDASTLYVASSSEGEPMVVAYAVAEDGSVEARRPFADVRGDGMAVDQTGNVYVAEPSSGVFVFDPNGRHLGSILTGRRTSNVAWGDDGSTLYITADSYLMRVRTDAVGLGFPSPAGTP